MRGRTGSPKGAALALAVVAVASTGTGAGQGAAGARQEGPQTAPTAPRADPLEVGARAPDFELPRVGVGGTVRLSDHREGPVVLAFFRGAW